MSLMVSISGVRGIVGESLTPDVILRYVSAFAEYCNRGKIVIGKDGRITGKMIESLVLSTLVSMGCKVVNLGTVPTPTIQIAVEQLKANGGIAITASHNPIEWNGLKFLSKNGTFLNLEEYITFCDIVKRGGWEYSIWDRLGSYVSDCSFIRKHIQMVLDLGYINVDQICKRKFKIVVDCIDAAGGVIIPALLRKLGCNVIKMNCDVKGIFSHFPEPIPDNLKDLCQRVCSEKADLGIAVDPDVDRLVLVDEKGEPLGEEYTIATVVKFILSHKHLNSIYQNVVVVNLSTTRAIDDIAKQLGATVIRTPVGEINVVQTMKQHNAVIGGEGNGGIILPDVHLGRDAIVGIGLILQQLSEFGGTLSELKSTLPQYFIAKSKINIKGIDPSVILERLKKDLSNGVVNTSDGLKIDYFDSWVHIRTSNTEPILRIIAEAPSSVQAESLIQKFVSYFN